MRYPRFFDILNCLLDILTLGKCLLATTDIQLASSPKLGESKPCIFKSSSSTKFLIFCGLIGLIKGLILFFLLIFVYSCITVGKLSDKKCIITIEVIK